jgi:hypothetical protein
VSYRDSSKRDRRQDQTECPDDRRPQTAREEILESDLAKLPERLGIL